MKDLLTAWFTYLIDHNTDPYTIEICEDPLGIGPDTSVSRKTFVRTFNAGTIVTVQIDHLKFDDYFEVLVTGTYRSYSFRIMYDSHGTSKYYVESGSSHGFDVLVLESMIPIVEAQLCRKINPPGEN
jgi:hypothetical protein